MSKKRDLPRRDLKAKNYFSARDTLRNPEPILNCGRRECDALRRIIEPLYLREIDFYLDLKGVLNEGEIFPRRSLEDQVPLNLSQAIRTYEALRNSEDDLEDGVPVSESEYLHNIGMHVTSDPGFAYHR